MPTHLDVLGRLQTATEMRGKAVIGLDRFQLHLASSLQTYRAQRAWKVMVALRKGYTLLTRRGLSAFVRWALALPFSGPGSLDEYELEFPNVWNYMPERLEVIGESLSAATSAPLANSKRTDPIPQPKHDVVILAIFDFEFRFQRPQQLAAQFARVGHRVFWLSPARFLPPFLAGTL